MKYEEIKELSYELLITKLPTIVYSYAVSIRVNHASEHVWNRIHRNKTIMTAVIPPEIENHIINRIKSREEFHGSKANIALLINAYWHVSHRPFEIALAEMMNLCVLESADMPEKNILILVDNLRRNRKRLFDPLYIGDMAWFFGVYLKSVLKQSKLICFPRPPEKYFFSEENQFPLKVDYGDIIVKNREGVSNCIEEFPETDCVIYICKYWERSGYPKAPLSIFWELRPCRQVIPKDPDPNVIFIQGFSEDNYLKLQNIIQSL
jgi:hypothetical protein